MRHAWSSPFPIRYAALVPAPLVSEPLEPIAGLAEEGARVRHALVSKRSDTLLRLFDFLLDRSVAGQRPKEQEIAQAVFGDASVTSDGATVRVCVHRLRRKLDDYYADRPGPRLVIARGEYRLSLSSDAPAAKSGGPAPAKPAWRTGRIRARIAAAAVILGALVCAAVVTRLGSASAPAHEPIGFLWAPIGGAGRNATVAIGDYYLVTETRTDGQPERLLRDLWIRSREDFDVYRMRHPETTERAGERDLRYVSSSAAIALRDVTVGMAATERQGAGWPGLVLASALTTANLKSDDIVYIGAFEGLSPLLRHPLFQASGFKIGASYDELIDKASGQRFVSDGAMLADGRIARRDYGYIASLPGPSGNHILFVSGMRDPAVLQMAELVRDVGRLAALHKRLNGHDQAFEALFRVRTLGSTNLGSQLVIARALDVTGIWDRAQPSQRFPNEMLEADPQ